MRILLCLLFCASVSGQIAEIDMTALEQFKKQQDQTLQAFKDQQERALERVMQQQILTHLLEQVNHQRALVVQLGGGKQVVSSIQQVIAEQCIDSL